MAHYRAKQTEIWDSGVVVMCMHGTIDISVLDVILWSFGAVVSKWPVTQKRLVVEQNEDNLGLDGRP